MAATPVHPLELSARVIDSGVADEPVNRVTNELAELADGVALVESFSHSAAVDTGDHLVVFDASGAATGRAVVEALRGWSSKPVRRLVYTHGHVDHVGGSGAFAADADAGRRPPPEVIAHRAVPDRLARYRATDGWNRAINARQFGWLAGAGGLGIGGSGRFLPDDVLDPDTTFDRTLTLDGDGIELHHERGETDDHTWAWIPARRAVVTGDFLIWNFPNAGNPQKVQRYPDRWAVALREMLALDPELLVPAHGLPIAGRDRIATVLGEVATALEQLVADVVAAMNAGATLDEVLHGVRVDPGLLERPWLRPLYDEPEFVVRNTWRLFGGWWDGNPARLKPPPDATLAAEVAALAGGARRLADRAAEVADAGDLRLACQLAEWAAQADPTDPGIGEVRTGLYRRRAAGETSLMAKGVFRSAAG
ncbi:MAG TPA: alkyl sulfatase dimerization domain-containing protein [Acidimicrobiales bacterium]|nr:alkyl sulfatase dimerization domain-containing protein [Acidimicrobiales bacterium]